MREDTLHSRELAKRFRKELTAAETILWSRLRRHPLHNFRRQHPIGPYVADFACVSARLVIELDGDSHGTEDAIRHDRARDAYMRREDWRIMRIPNHDVFKHLSSVLDSIDAFVSDPKKEIAPLGY